MNYGKRKEASVSECTTYLTKNPHPYVVQRHNPTWLDYGDEIEYVALEQYDSEARMPVRVLVHWTGVFEYMLAKWPAGGSVVWLQTTNGRRIHAKTRHAAWSNIDEVARKQWDAAPAILHVAHCITTLQDGPPLLEVKGAADWCYHRDNARFEQATRKEAAHG